MHGIETAQACYNNASPEDQVKLRKITKYEKNSMILLTPEGKELFRSHGTLKPTSLIQQWYCAANKYRSTMETLV